MKIISPFSKNASIRIQSVGYLLLVLFVRKLVSAHPWLVSPTIYNRRKPRELKVTHKRAIKINSKPVFGCLNGKDIKYNKWGHPQQTSIIINCCVTNCSKLNIGDTWEQWRRRHDFLSGWAKLGPLIYGESQWRNENRLSDGYSYRQTNEFSSFWNKSR